MGKLRSNRVKRTPQAGITSDRYQFLGLDQAEPNLGDPTVGPSSVGANPIKVGTVYNIAAVGQYPGERYWVNPAVGIGTSLGVISVYANDLLPNNAFQRIHGLNFVGTGVTLETPPLELVSGSGIGIATIRFTVTDIQNRGQIGQVLYNTDSGYAYGADDLYYVSGNVGIGSTIPKQKLDVSGNGYFSGIVTASQFYGSFVGNLSGTSTTSTNVIGGIASVTSLSVSGISTLGVTSATNLNSNNLVVSEVSSLGLVKIATDGTSGIITSSNPGVTTVFYYGDGSGLTNITATTITGVSSITISENTTDQTQYLTYVTGIGTVSGLNVNPAGLVYNPFSGNLGIGITNPANKFVIGGETIQFPLQFQVLSTLHSTSRRASVAFGGTNENQDPDWQIVQDRLGNGTKNLSFYSTALNANLLTFSPEGNSIIQPYPLLIGTESTTGTTQQKLQVTGGAYVSDNLGIGTTNPQATLDVGVGSVRISNGDFRLNGTPYIFNTRNVGGDYISNGGTDGVLNVVNITPGGPIGLSVKIPGVGATVGTFEAPNIANLYTTMATKHDGTQAISYFNGLLGIGTTNPTDSLDVNGTTRLRGLLRDYNNFEGSPGQLLQATSNGVNWVNPNDIGVASTISVLEDSSNQTQYLTFVTGIGDTTLGITTTSNALTFNPSTGNLGIGTTPNPNVYLSVGSPPFSKINNDAQFGNLGVGNEGFQNSFISLNGYWNPSTKEWNYIRNGHSSILQFKQGKTLLRYFGSGNSGVSTTDGYSILSTDTNRQVAINKQIHDHNNLNLLVDIRQSLYQDEQYADLGLTNPTLVGITTAGNLGIGTTNPLSTVHIVGNGITTGEALQVDGNIRVGISTTSNYIAFRGTYNDGVNAQGGDEPGFSRYTHTYIGERIYGPGTQTSELLLFKGNDSHPVNPGPDRIRLAGVGGIVFDTADIIGDIRGTFEEVGVSTLLTTKMALTQAGNLGIGTINPTEKLTVSGTVLADGFISVGNTTPIQISLVGNKLTFTASGIGSTTLTLF
jgi:hypothetical protein